MRSLALACAALFALCVTSTGLTFYDDPTPGAAMTKAGQAFVEGLTAEQKQTALLDYEIPERLDWHFIPKDYRKGLQIKHMDEALRKKAHRLLRVALSEAGYKKTTDIMSLESLLHELEGGAGRFARDPERYYFTLFGAPDASARWGLSVEGHHLSLNFVIDNGKVISSTPQFFAANPATVKTKNKSGIELGTRVLADEEQLAFDLVNDLSDDQRQVAVLAPKAPREIRDAGSPQPPTAAPEGIAWTQLTESQQKTLKALIDAYCAAMPDKIASARLTDIEAAGYNTIHFAWAGPLKPGIGHYYRVQGPTFLIEFVNTQPDAAGNPANHIHCVWRDMRGDFGLPL